MDAGRLDRVRTHVTEGGHLSPEVASELLSWCSALADEVLSLRQALSTVSADLAQSALQVDVWRADADRLASWIVAHPGDHREVLTLHDRSMA